MYRQKQIRKMVYLKNKIPPSKPHILSDKLIALVRSPVTLLVLLLACSTRRTLASLSSLQPISSGNVHHVQLVPNTSIKFCPYYAHRTWRSPGTKGPSHWDSSRDLFSHVIPPGWEFLTCRNIKKKREGVSTFSFEVKT